MERLPRTPPPCDQRQLEFPTVLPHREMLPSNDRLWISAIGGFLVPALSTRILSLVYKAVSREVRVSSAVNRLLVRRLLRPALISEQFRHVHLPSNLSEQVDHFLRPQIPPSTTHMSARMYFAKVRYSAGRSHPRDSTLTLSPRLPFPWAGARSDPRTTASALLATNDIANANKAAFGFPSPGTSQCSETVRS